VNGDDRRVIQDSGGLRFADEALLKLARLVVIAASRRFCSRPG